MSVDVFSDTICSWCYIGLKNLNIAIELLFYKYFIEGKDIGSLDVLINVSKDADMYDENIEKYIISNQHNHSLSNKEKQAKNIGINSVPCFIFNKEIVINGAQPTRNFIQIIDTLNKDV